MYDPDVDTLYDRARELVSQQRTVLTSLSTGVVAVFFLALTAGVTPPLTGIQKISVAISLVSMGIAVRAGILAWRADAQRWYWWAKHSESLNAPNANTVEGEAESDDLYSKLTAPRRATIKYDKAQRLSFSTGIAFSIGYVALRIFEL